MTIESAFLELFWQAIIIVAKISFVPLLIGASYFIWIDNHLSKGKNGKE